MKIWSLLTYSTTGKEKEIFHTHTLTNIIISRIGYVQSITCRLNNYIYWLGLLHRVNHTILPHLNAHLPALSLYSARSDRDTGSPISLNPRRCKLMDWVINLNIKNWGVCSLQHLCNPLNYFMFIFLCWSLHWLTITTYRLKLVGPRQYSCRHREYLPCMGGIVPT